MVNALNQPSGINPTNRLAMNGISTTQPFSFRDGLDMIQLIEHIKEGCETLQRQWQEFQDLINGDQSSLEDAWKQFQTQYATDFANLRLDLTDLIKDASNTDNIIVRNSAYGSQDILQRVLDSIYDADRRHALFVKDFDDLALTPAQFDALQVSPRRFDLDSTDIRNEIQGDITKANITWIPKD